MILYMYINFIVFTLFTFKSIGGLSQLKTFTKQRQLQITFDIFQYIYFVFPSKVSHIV